MTSPSPRRKKLTREERARQTYDSLMEAAARIVGERGYAATSIARVTEEAGVSHGTFYNYFTDRQALFDALLPHVGQQMVGYIAGCVPAALRGPEREVARFRAYCAFLKENPGFYRILYEAEVFAPKAHAAHIERLTEGYRRALGRSAEAGEIAGFSPEELDAIIPVLLGARAYVSMRYKQTGEIPEAAIEGYAKLVGGGLFR